MHIVLVGTGKTGQSIERLAHEQGHQVVDRFNSTNPLPDALNISPESPVDVIIDFTTPALALDHIKKYCAWNIPAIIGTTGWYDSLDMVASWVDNQDASILYAPNFSIGVTVTALVVEVATALINRLQSYDAYVHEFHHRLKLDSPSGTALHLANRVLEGLERKTHLEIETQHQQIAPDALHVSSTRTGHIFGQHTVGFDSPFDHIKISHESKTRDSFAHGALRAAEWLIGRKGLFTLDDLLKDWL